MPLDDDFRPARLTTLAPAILERRVGGLIRRYVRQRSRLRALAVVRYLEALCRHPELHGDPERFCAYRRLTRHWRWLALQYPDATASYMQ